MVTDSLPERSSGSDGRDRGQVILIGAITLAFIIIGVVVIYNGVLYTETLSSADTGQSADVVETTEREIEQGIGCILASEEIDDEDREDEIKAFADLYRNSTAESSPAVVTITDIDPDPKEVTVTYDSADLSYVRTIENISEDDCPNA